MWPRKEAVDPNGKERKEYEWTYPVTRVNTHPALCSGQEEFCLEGNADLRTGQGWHFEARLRRQPVLIVTTNG
jgi:hypothetical protein